MSDENLCISLNWRGSKCGKKDGGVRIEDQCIDLNWEGSKWGKKDGALT